MTSEYVCPKDIQKVFDNDPAEGRKLAIDWLGTLSLRTGDRVWMPEIGWLTKTENALQ